ncbi:MAG: hypothetical protein CVV44_17600 [Spirochaetae bacterium HGW-Spirochaetae-1]|nr:MAG: hypothetical protein CVV44_17600 [Spirochaetae bacterium HGW-Spirochaetae-1]
MAFSLGGGFAYLGDETKDYSYKFDASGFFSYIISPFFTPYSLLRFSHYKLDGFKNPDDDEWFGDIGYANCYLMEMGAGVQLFSSSWVSLFLEGGRLINLHGDVGENIGKS